MGLGFDTCGVDLFTVDSQFSQNRGVTVLVTGALTFLASPPAPPPPPPPPNLTPPQIRVCMGVQTWAQGFVVFRLNSSWALDLCLSMYLSRRSQCGVPSSTCQRESRH